MMGCVVPEFVYDNFMPTTTKPATINVTVWEYLHGYMEAPTMIEIVAKHPRFERELLRDEWDVAATGANGSRMYMRGNTPVCYEIHT